jgi:hypothetical protein
MIEVLPNITLDTFRVIVAIRKVSVNRASTEGEQFLILYLVSSLSCAGGFSHNQSIDCINDEYSKCRSH